MAKSQTKTPKSWTDVSGKAIVFGNTFKTKKGSFISYSTTISSKNEDGDYDRVYVKVRFKKDDDPETEGRFDIKIKSGFLAVDAYENKKGDQVTQPVLVVTDYEVIDDDE